MTNPSVYTIITFAPVQGFIVNSRKLRDLYGSSFILSFLARSICNQVEKSEYKLISPSTPSTINLTQGTPNQIIIQGKDPFPKKTAQTAFNDAWEAIVTTCQKEIEETLLPNYAYHWGRCWNAQINHSWEFFYSVGETITEARQQLNNEKYQRDWIGINWVGESSTLSGSDAIAWYGMADKINPKLARMRDIDDEIKEFYTQLIKVLPDTIIDEKEQLSIPELIKRLITLDQVSSQLNLPPNQLPSVEIPYRFSDLNRRPENPEDKRWTGWFQGDGDSIGHYFQSLIKLGKDEAEELEKFSKAMIEWGANLKRKLPKPEDNPNRQRRKLDAEGRIIYAGGDDFLGVLYRNDEPKLTAKECVNWLSQFPDFWREHQQPITVSIGFVWAAPSVPQRDVLEHCREAEKSAKQKGRDRIAFRILYNSGQYIEWVCPWWLLNKQRLQKQLRLFPSIPCPEKTLLESYQDREKGENWTHFYEDVAILEARHAFYVDPQAQEIEVSVALGLIKIYFGEHYYQILSNQEFWFNLDKTEEGNPLKITGILGKNDEFNQSNFYNISQRFNDWVINLAKVGFQLNKS